MKTLLIQNFQIQQKLDPQIWIWSRTFFNKTGDAQNIKIYAPHLDDFL